MPNSNFSEAAGRHPSQVCPVGLLLHLTEKDLGRNTGTDRILSYTARRVWVRLARWTLRPLIGKKGGIRKVQLDRSAPVRIEFFKNAAKFVTTDCHLHGYPVTEVNAGLRFRMKSYLCVSSPKNCWRRRRNLSPMNGTIKVRQLVHGCSGLPTDFWCSRYTQFEGDP